MDEYDAIELALLRIDRRDRKTDVKADRTQNHCGDSEPGYQLASQSIKSCRCRIFKPIDSQLDYSIDIRNACAVTHGVNTKASNNKAPNSDM